ncbi:hypothetical protein D9758_005067 [Tetrapyrgos nigripes]|uniref:Uncharacterized protein n=1 Tax=Tetrapyrgos nigripes TaxID=182062 RepID=A0A8H5GWA5_9AGAR|nr:hypothetical protein D9758_005067 [Tetrapyrgos nigripes]
MYKGEGCRQDNPKPLTLPTSIPIYFRPPLALRLVIRPISPMPVIRTKKTSHHTSNPLPGRTLRSPSRIDHVSATRSPSPSLQVRNRPDSDQPYSSSSRSASPPSISVSSSSSPSTFGSSSRNIIPPTSPDTEADEESDGDDEETKEDSSSEKKRTTVYEREARFLVDPCVKGVGPRAVDCAACNFNIKLDKRKKGKGYGFDNWIKHKGRCPKLDTITGASRTNMPPLPLSRQKFRQDSNRYIEPLRAEKPYTEPKNSEQQSPPSLAESSTGVPASSPSPSSSPFHRSRLQTKPAVSSTNDASTRLTIRLPGRACVSSQAVEAAVPATLVSVISSTNDVSTRPIIRLPAHSRVSVPGPVPAPKQEDTFVIPPYPIPGRSAPHPVLSAHEDNAPRETTVTHGSLALAISIRMEEVRAEQYLGWHSEGDSNLDIARQVHEAGGFIGYLAASTGRIQLLEEHYGGEW